MKIKVLHVVGAMNRGGAEVMLMDMFRHISQEFHFDFLVNYKLSAGIQKADFDEEILASGSKLIYIPAQWDLGLIKYTRYFQKIIKEHGIPDIVHIHMNAKCGVIAMAAKKSGVKHVIAHSHADLKFRGNLISRFASNIELRFQKRLIAKYADFFWGCSPEANLSLFYKRLLTPKKSAVINNAIDVNAFVDVSIEAVQRLRTSWEAGSNTIIFGNIGRVVAHKNIGFILDILNKYKEINTDFLFVYAGRIEQEAYHDKFLKKAEEYNLKDHIKYIGITTDVPLVFSSFDVFLGTALKEGFGMVAVEAQAAGLPCLLYKGFPETVDMELGLVKFLDSFNELHWVKAIGNIEFKDMDFQLIKEKIVSKGFDIQSNVKSVELMYKQTVNE